MPSEQTELRNRFRKFLESEGTTQKFISYQCGIERPILSRFKNAQIDLGYAQVSLLDDFLKSKQY